MKIVPHPQERLRMYADVATNVFGPYRRWLCSLWQSRRRPGFESRRHLHFAFPHLTVRVGSRFFSRVRDCLVFYRVFILVVDSLD